MIFYDHGTGVTIDADVLSAEMRALGVVLEMERNSEDPYPPPEAMGYVEALRPRNPDDDPCRAEVYREAAGRRVVLDAEEFPARERVEGLARLVRRILPDPSKVLGSMTPEQFDAFKGRKGSLLGAN